LGFGRRWEIDGFIGIDNMYQRSSKLKKIIVYILIREDDTIFYHFLLKISNRISFIIVNGHY
jgi:hypothetical protein